MKNNLVCLLLMCVFSFTALQAQSLGEFKASTSGSYGVKKLKQANKRIYIAQFKTNFEVFKDAVSYKSGSSFGGRNSATAKLAVALDGLDENELKRITNEVYNDFVSDLKDAGLEIITADEAGKTEVYKDYTRREGGEIIPTKLPGVVTVTPENFSYYVKGLDKEGNEKKGWNPFSMDTDLNKNKKLAKELGDVLVAKVDLNILFIEVKEGWSPGTAKVTFKTDLRLVSSDNITAEKKKGLRFKGSNDVFPVKTMVHITDSKGNNYNGTLKKALPIEGVLEKQKIKAVQSKGMSETATSFNPIVYTYDKTTRKFQSVPVDGAAYIKGAKMAMSKFLKHHLAELKDKMK
ncbi:MULTISPECIES: hypothetical protein [Nonlabens]|uniref:hypothetical protein n=1 Tax=Nonlabens TaxID=363408 RepID=UPI001428CC86|nr:hypothetical protein [Nonlabens sp. SY33080]